MTAWLLTWLWQGTALAISLSILLHFLPRINASTRYVIWWGAFAALIWLGWESWPNTSIAIATAIAAPPAMRGQAGAVQVQSLPAWALTLVLTAWITIALFRLLRILPGVHLLYRLKDECRPFPRGVEEQLPLWREARGRRVRLMLCDRLPGAAVLGLHDPYIAVPPSLLQVLSTSDLEQVILHEYGHVQRRDDWMRLLQGLVQSALWIHPAAFLIGRQLNLEREVACDDWVIARTGAPRSYAGCLSRVAESRRSTVKPAFAPALFGARRDLVRRVDRLLDSRRNARHQPSAFAAAAGISMVAACAVHLSAFPLVAEEMDSLPSPAFVIPGVASATPRANVTIRPKPDDGPPAFQPALTVKLDAAEVLKPEPTLEDASAENTSIETGPTEIEAPLVIVARSFHATYQVPDSLDGDSVERQSPWRLAGHAGAAIGTATKKASTGIASAFTRAGVSIARSF